jgi:hypothetical protein
MKFEKVTTTPTAPYTEGAVYLVAAGKEHFEMLAVTKDKQKVRRTINAADVDERINKAISELGALEIVANIAARDVLSLSANAMVLVLDASADSTVKAGGATYAYSHSDTSWTKISEAESLDLALSWANLTGKPTSTAAEIDTAVGNAHGHANLSELKKIGQAPNGTMQYDGVDLVTSGTAAW